jgi:hypothetical protein
MRHMAVLRFLTALQVIFLAAGEATAKDSSICRLRELTDVGTRELYCRFLILLGNA